MVKKQKKESQRLLNHSLELHVQLQSLEKQLQELQSRHFQRCWRNGNLNIGWHYSQRDPQQGNKFDILPKDKIFSLSSLSSQTSKQLQQTAFKNINGPAQGRFISNKKKYKKKKKKAKLFNKPLE